MRTLIAALVLCSASTAFAGPKDEEAIKTRVDEFIALFNKGDAKAIAANYFTPDATLVNPVGVKATGTAEVEKLIERDSSTILKGAKMEMKVASVRMVGKDAAWVELEHSVAGAKTPDGKTTNLTFHVPTLMVKKGKNWMVAEARPYAYLPAPPAAPPPPPPTAKK